MKRRTGLTLIELAVAVVIVGVVASVAVPAAMNRRILANEASAVAALRDIATAQERFKAAKYVDLSATGVGEYGLLRELSGAVGARANGTASTVGNVVNPPLLPPEFRRFNRNSEVRRAGYLFRMFLPGYGYSDPGGVGVPEFATGSLIQPVDSDLAETTWCCYAWPERRGVTGGRTFFVNQTADIVATDAGYSGTAAIGGYPPYGRHWRRGPKFNAGAAFAAPGLLSGITGAVAVGTIGRDGRLWQVVAPAAAERTLVARATLYGYPARDRGSFEMVSRQTPSGTRESLVVRLPLLRPGHEYEISARVLGSSTDAFHVVVKANADGRAGFRFDSRRDVYPAGLASLTELVGGRFAIGATDDNEFFSVFDTIPEFKAVGHRTPTPETIAADEATAIAGLREIAAAQTKFQEMKAVDVSQDGVGEFGLLRELTGVVGVRTNSYAGTVGNLLRPPVLSRDFSVFNAASEASRSGYLFKMFLPGFGLGVAEVYVGSLGNPVDPDLAATTWCCYASPQRWGKTGERTFFINQTGDIVATDASSYTGIGNFVASNAGAAFRIGGALPNITGAVAVGTRGNDNNRWSPVPDRPDEHEYVVSGALDPTPAVPGATGSFVLKSRLLRNDTDDTIDVTASGLANDARYTIVLADAAGAASVAVWFEWSDSQGRISPFRCFGRCSLHPYGATPPLAFGGGTFELRDETDTPVLSGAVPVFATVLGPTVADSSAVFHVKRPLDEQPRSLPRSGTLDVRVTNAPDGRREQLVVEVATYDRGATYVVVALDDQDVATPLGAIRVAGLRGTGALTVDTKRGDAVPGAIVALSGARIEVRASTGAVVLAGTMPVVK